MLGGGFAGGGLLGGGVVGGVCVVVPEVSCFEPLLLEQLIRIHSTSDTKRAVRNLYDPRMRASPNPEFFILRASAYNVRSCVS